MGSIRGQTVGDLSSPYSISGWDSPVEYTTHYQLPIYQLLSNPGGWINKSQAKVDSLLNALVVYTDSLQMSIRNDTLIFSNYMSGHGVIEANKNWDTVSVSGLDSNDVIVVTEREEGIATHTKAMGVVVKDNEFYVSIPSTESYDIKYNWIWIRKYQ